MSIWSQFPRALCLPDDCGCEFVDLNAWIAQPSAFWSSSFHLIFALLLFVQVKQKNQRLKLWIFSLVLLALASHFAHGSFLEFAMATDFAGIVLVSSFFPLHKWISKKISNTMVQMVLIFLYQMGLWFVFYSLYKWVKFSLAILVFCIAFWEIYRSEGKAFFKAKLLHFSVGILFVSFVFFMFDELKIFCAPSSWYSGHSVWHFGTGLSLYLYGKWRFRST